MELTEAQRARKYKEMSRSEKIAYIQSCSHLWGTDTDKNISLLTGIHSRSIASARLKAGIPRFGQTTILNRPANQKMTYVDREKRQSEQNERFDNLLRSAFRPVSI